MGHIPTRHLLTACFVKLWAREILFPQMYLCRMIFCFGLFLFLTNFAVKMHTASQPASQPASQHRATNCRKVFFSRKDDTWIFVSFLVPFATTGRNWNSAIILSRFFIRTTAKRGRIHPVFGRSVLDSFHSILLVYEVLGTRRKRNKKLSMQCCCRSGLSSWWTKRKEVLTFFLHLSYDVGQKVDF